MSATSMKHKHILPTMNWLPIAILAFVYTLPRTEVLGAGEEALGCDRRYLRRINGKCYYFSVKKLNWFGALNNCLRKGLTLADLSRPQDFYAVVEFLASKGNTDDFWYGGNDLQHEGRFQYISSGRLIRYFSNNSLLEPSGHSDCDDCLEIRIRSNLTIVADDNCQERQYFICSERYCDVDANGKKKKRHHSHEHLHHFHHDVGDDNDEGGEGGDGGDGGDGGETTGAPDTEEPTDENPDTASGESETTPSSGESGTSGGDGKSEDSGEPNESSSTPGGTDTPEEPDITTPTFEADTTTEPTQPDSGEGTAAPDSGEVTPAPDSGESTPTVTPAEGEDTTPAEGGGETTPAEGGGETTPAEGGGETTPAEGGGTPPEGGGGEETTTPAAPAGSEQPDSGGESEPPPPGRKESGSGETP